jgi:hypothetical protein
MIYYHHEENPFRCYYDFEECGDTITTHSHPVSRFHDVFVISGSVRVNDKILKAGERYVPDNALPHEIVALTPFAAIVNRYLNGKPDDYKDIPLEKLSGRIE